MKHYPLYLILLLLSSASTSLVAMDCGGDVVMAEHTNPLQCPIIEQLQQQCEQEFTRMLAFQQNFTAVQIQATATKLMLLEIWHALLTLRIIPYHNMEAFKEMITPVWEQAQTDLERAKAEISRNTTMLVELEHIHIQAVTTQEATLAELAQQCACMLNNEIIMAQKIQCIRLEEQEKICQIYSKMDALREEYIAQAKERLAEEDAAEEERGTRAAAEEEIYVAPPQPTCHTHAAYRFSALTPDGTHLKRTELHVAVLECAQLHRNIQWYRKTLAVLEAPKSAAEQDKLFMRLGLYPDLVRRSIDKLKTTSADQKFALRQLLYCISPDTLAAQDIYGKTALHYAACIDDEAIITMIANIAKTPDDKKKLLEISDQRGYTALDYAQPGGNVVKFIQKIAPHIPQKRLSAEARADAHRRVMDADEADLKEGVSIGVTRKAMGWIGGSIVAAAAAAIAVFVGLT